ncbi:MAG: SGNH/GDSL hydrolase family protein [Ktedonobacteraceae bacterium]|nr:SGNH/GDSL hydrolase family protein [Ktedonobacteraceae bacterium]
MTRNLFNKAENSQFLHFFQSHPRLRVIVLWLFLCALLLPFFPGCGVQSPASPAAGSRKAPEGQQENARLVYVAIGASDTFGYGTSDPYRENWASDLAGKLGARYRLVNLGVPGIRMQEALKVELPVALDARPDLVTIWLAVNDIINKVPVENYTRGLDTMLSRLRAAKPQMRIAVANVPDLTLLPYFIKQPSFDRQALQSRIQAYNTAIAATALRYQAILVDLSARTYDIKNHPEYVSQDGLHPTAAGYARLAEVFYQALEHGSETRAR